MANNWAEINTALTVCGLDTVQQQNFIMQAEGLYSWLAFTLIVFWCDCESVQYGVSDTECPKQNFSQHL